MAITLTAQTKDGELIISETVYNFAKRYTGPFNIHDLTDQINNENGEEVVTSRQVGNALSKIKQHLNLVYLDRGWWCKKIVPLSFN